MQGNQIPTPTANIQTLIIREPNKPDSKTTNCHPQLDSEPSDTTATSSGAESFVSMEDSTTNTADHIQSLSKEMGMLHDDLNTEGRLCMPASAENGVASINYSEWGFKIDVNT